jgi:hypothetical protein
MNNPGKLYILEKKIENEDLMLAFGFIRVSSR